MGVVSIAVGYPKGRSNTFNKFYSIVSWKTQDQQNNKLQNGNLVAPKRTASTTYPGGDASSNPKHLLFPEWRHTGIHQKRQPNTVIEGWRCRQPGSHPLKL
jgi:hypothetical protein